MPTHFLSRDEGRLAYSVDGTGPLVVCVPGLGDLREEYRFLAARLVASGFQVATLDLRGHGKSSTGWSDLSAEAIGDDVTALIGELGATQAVVIGTSMAAGSAAWATANDPARVKGCVLIGPFVRDVGPPWQRAMYRAMFRVLLAPPWGVRFWIRFWASLFPTSKPADFHAYAARLRANLHEPGRLAALRGMMLCRSRQRIEARLAEVSAPTLVILGTKDSDFKDPAAEAELVAGKLDGSVAMIEGAGHYPHVEFPDQTGARILAFARSCFVEDDGQDVSKEMSSGPRVARAHGQPRQKAMTSANPEKW